VQYIAEEAEEKEKASTFKVVLLLLGSAVASFGWMIFAQWAFLNTV